MNGFSETIIHPELHVLETRTQVYPEGDATGKVMGSLNPKTFIHFFIITNADCGTRGKVIGATKNIVIRFFEYDEYLQKISAYLFLRYSFYGPRRESRAIFNVMVKLELSSDHHQSHWKSSSGEHPHHCSLATF